ncbi:MAG: 1,4-alpha-glucan branching protein GlgB [Clostridium sp.]|nr:1,4-alpha-glucan branching protein GlgB [Clostridium sp.]
MDGILYDLMDWAGIEEITFAESSDPHRILGPHMTEKGMLVQAYIPTARDVTVKLTGSGKQYNMEMADESGFFAALVPVKKITDYTLLVFYDNGVLTEKRDPYAYKQQIPEKELKKFAAGIHYDIYSRLGAHPTEIGGTEGVLFAVWAPGAMRVSVVGDFNLWDGRRHQMRRLGDSGVFELFIPGVPQGALYKYEIKNHNSTPFLKADPYANAAEMRPDNASMVWNIGEFAWTDEEWMKARAGADPRKKPLSIYEVHLGSWKRREQAVDRGGKVVPGSEFLNYRDLARDLADYVKQMGYTHIELMPVMEHPLDASWGYQVTGYYAPTRRFGTPDDFMYFMNYMHENGIGVILDWVPANFPKDAWGLASFDGSCLYETEHTDAGMLSFRYARPEVSNFLIANALFWAEKYHADGLRLDAVGSMLYLDYGKNPGEWVANLYGSHENLDAVEFLKHLSSIFHSREKGALLIAEEQSAWPGVTAPLNSDGLGFDLKWNAGWLKDFMGYMQCDSLYRHDHYNELTFSMIYSYSENFILPYPHSEAVYGKGTAAGRMPGRSLEEKFANLRAAYGFMLGHPGKKLLFMGQDIGQLDEWDENRAVEWDLLQYPLHANMQAYTAALNELYAKHPALWQKDFDPSGFEWINCMDAENNIVSFLRISEDPAETLLFVANFAPVLHEKYVVGVPFAGKYKEIFNSEDARFGGKGAANPRVRPSKAGAADGRSDFITIKIPELAVLVFACTPEAPAVKTERTAESAPAGKKGVGKASAGQEAPESLVESVKKAAAKRAGSVKRAAADRAESVKKAAADTAGNVKKAASKRARSVKNALTGNTEKKADDSE